MSPKQFSTRQSSGCCGAALLGLLLLGTHTAPAQERSSKEVQGRAAASAWTTTWGSAQLQPYGTEVLPAGVLEHATLREVVHVSAGGARLRVCVSNAFGKEALHLEAVHVALRTDGASGAIVPGSDRTLAFAGHAALAVPWVRSTSRTNDAKQPDHLLPAFDSGDHLHPGPAGYKRLREAVPLTFFVR